MEFIDDEAQHSDGYEREELSENEEEIEEEEEEIEEEPPKKPTGRKPTAKSPGASKPKSFAVKGRRVLSEDEEEKIVKAKSRGRSPEVTDEEKPSTSKQKPRPKSAKANSLQGDDEHEKTETMKRKRAVSTANNEEKTTPIKSRAKAVKRIETDEKPSTSKARQVNEKRSCESMESSTENDAKRKKVSDPNAVIVDLSKPDPTSVKIPLFRARIYSNWYVTTNEYKDKNYFCLRQFADPECTKPLKGSTHSIDFLDGIQAGMTQLQAHIAKFTK